MKKKPFFIFIGISIFYGVGLVFRPAYGIGSGVLLLTALYYYKTLLPVVKENRQFIIFLLLTSFLFILPLLFHHASGREYDRFSRILAILPIFLLFYHYSVSYSFWTLILSIGAIISCSFAFISPTDDAGRFGGVHHPIQFGDLALLTGFLALTSHQKWQQKKAFSFLVIGGFLAGIYASLLSGSRGGWLAFFPVGVFWGFYFFPQQRKKTCALFLCLTLLVLCLLPIVEHRILAIWQDIEAFRAGNSNTSIGLRFEMWQLAGQLFSQSPIFGVGSQKLQASLNSLLLSQNVSPEVIQSLHHLHNDFIDTAARLGTAGLMGLLCLYFLPLWWFFAAWKKGNLYAGSGVVLCLSFCTFSLTQSVLQHHSGIIFYLLTLSLIYAQITLCNMQNTNADLKDQHCIH